MVNGNGFETIYSYDELNRRVTEEGYDDGGELLHDFFYDYDAASQLLRAGDDYSQYSYTYDLAGRLETVSNAGSIGVPYG